jgi:hypothetical protein
MDVAEDISHFVDLLSVRDGDFGAELWGRPVYEAQRDILGRVYPEFISGLPTSFLSP